MFTVKFYNESGSRIVLKEAESFTILKSLDGSGAEISLHQKNSADDIRIDIGYEENVGRDVNWPPIYQKAIIENSHGRTTEIIGLGLPKCTGKNKA